jgi:hypothetical protein
MNWVIKWNKEFKFEDGLEHVWEWFLPPARAVGELFSTYRYENHVSVRNFEQAATGDIVFCFQVDLHSIVGGCLIAERVPYPPGPRCLKLNPQILFDRPINGGDWPGMSTQPAFRPGAEAMATLCCLSEEAAREVFRISGWNP